VDPLTSRSIRELRELLDQRDVSALEVARAHLERIEELDESTVRSLLTVTRELAEEQARRADERLANGDAQPLLGIPMILKDVLTTRGIRTTAGSKILENFVPIEDATITVAWLKPAPCCSAKPTWTSSPWARPRKTRRTPHAQSVDLDRCPAGRAAARPRRWAPSSLHLRSAPTPVARSANPARCAAWWASSRRTVGSAATG